MIYLGAYLLIVLLIVGFLWKAVKTRQWKSSAQKPKSEVETYPNFFQAQTVVADRRDTVQCSSENCCKAATSEGVKASDCDPSSPSESAACCSATTQESPCCSSSKSGSQQSAISTLPSLKIIYGSQGGNAEDFASKLFCLLNEVASKHFDVRLVDVADYEADDLVLENYVVLIFSTYIEGRPPPKAEQFFLWVTEEANEPRAGNLLRKLKFSVFGLGDSAYPKRYYNKVGRTLDRCFNRMGAKRFYKRGEGDESNDTEKAFQDWMHGMYPIIEKYHLTQLPEPVDDAETSESDNEEAEDLTDLEDLGGIIASGEKKAAVPNAETKDMLSGSQKRTLTKQGYKIIGSHSSVKMCRWTKSMLRGRGGCYKHTFYGIDSHRCMETTPSMACANKCVFCWRHHKNPVGTEWRWNTDPPEMIVEQAVAKHQQMIKQAKGIPGVIPERYEEGFRIRHCALSLVGEPIIYPEINKFLELLHNRGISSFLVTNAQFPDQIKTLIPVTQLYLSIDAATPESLKAVDRPLFSDFWERFLSSMDALKEKGQRTVYRLTLVKGWNMTEVRDYAALIRRGCPDFVEIKGVTYCGGKKPVIGMKEVPWHEEVVNYASAIAAELEGDYEIACEHEHSNCILLADTKFLKDGEWYTWIDFDKFIELSSSAQSFSTEDYVAKTPSWAVFGSEERGFDPVEIRVGRRGKPIEPSRAPQGA